MKILLYSDVHWSTTSSLIKKFGTSYSIRLEHLIDSMNFINDIAAKNNCECTICLGDFMDKSVLSDEEITALNDVQFLNNIKHYFLVGNHESADHNLLYSSVNCLKTSNKIIINSPTSLIFDSLQFDFLPYITETDREILTSYFDLNNNYQHVLISHNDIANINYGRYESKIGFPLDDIKNNFILAFNGHLHNSGWLAKNVLNVGSISGHNFTNDSEVYKYGFWIFDTISKSVDFIENPYAFNFYKLELNTKIDFAKLKKIKDNAVLSIKCNEALTPEARELLNTLSDKIIDSRLISIKSVDAPTEESVNFEDLTIDHLAKFVECCHERIDNTAVLDFELEEICK